VPNAVPAKAKKRRADSPNRRSGVGRALAALSLKATEWAGSSWAFGLAVFVILVWLASGPIFHYSDTWQLVINTGTTVVTFVMVFLIQRAQNKESKAVQLKLNEIVAAIEGASNRLIDVESLSEEEIETLHKHYAEMTRLAVEQGSLRDSHSIEEARERAEAKGLRSRPRAASVGTPRAQPEGRATSAADKPGGS